jgi:hypothetical protein
MTNYISQPVDGAKNVIICLDVTVVSPSDTIYGNPSEEFPSALPSVVTPEFVGSVSDGFCTHCEQEPYNWSSLGHNIVETVRAENTSTTVDGAMANKSYQFAAYRMYARVRYGYLGKGNRKPLPLSCSLLLLLLSILSFVKSLSESSLVCILILCVKFVPVQHSMYSLK